ncbi:hypothetical protein JTB14_010038 [Gonioctena quinquepunctata]|nr:hypothetical protein JTB14_010038 [Gonioctena quinquepunctata]
MMLHVVSFLVFILLSSTASARATECHMDIRQLQERHPLFLSVETNEILYPNIGSSIINLNSDEIFELDCPGAGNIQVGDHIIGEIVLARCVSGWDVEIFGEIFNLSTIVCTRRITSVARYTGQPCWQRYREIEIGFQIQDGRFLHEMTICFDDAERNVIYSQFLLTKQIGSQTTGNTRPGWTEGNFYNLAVRLNNLYVNAMHRTTINRQLGLADDDTKYVKATGNYYLARGHLTARSDFKYNVQQQATFHYVNSVPQWQTFNANNWFFFERNLRVYASSNMVDLIVYTGTYGITTLPHQSTGKEIPLYFFNQQNNQNKSMPIPELFWKIAYDPLNQAGVSLLGINNPYQTDIAKSIICNDIADQLTWLTFDRFRIEAGYIYACTIDDLRRVIPQIPRFQVRHILY